MIAYTLTRSRRKTIAICVKADGTVEIRAPLKLAKSQIERFVASKESTIKKMQEKLAARQLEEKRELPPSPYEKGEFERAIRELMEAWRIKLGVEVTFVSARAMTSRWGSCTPKTGRIRLNTALIYCPRECLEYVIVHELAHLLENNHSPRFWAIVEEALPDYKKTRKALKELSWLLSAQKEQ